MTPDKTIAPTDLRDFLKSQGWTLVEEQLRHQVYAFRHNGFPRRQLVFPTDLTAPDYAESVTSVLEKLADLTRQSVSALRAQAQSVRDDVMRVRIYGDGAAEQGLPLSFASLLVENTAKLLRAAACTVLRPRVHHPRTDLREANQLIEKARFGHTEVGSYVLRVSCPLNAIDSQGNLFPGSDVGDTFVRRVTLSLQQGLTRLTEAIQADRLPELVDQQKASPTLLSANLCEAVSEMYDEKIDNSLDLGFQWSAIRPVPRLARPVRIQRDFFRRIEEVGRELRAVEEQAEGNSFAGTVEGLEGDLDSDGRRSGDVILSLLVPGERKTVSAKTRLSSDDYAKADAAHMRTGSIVRVTGRLRPGRQPRQLTDVSSFEVFLAPVGDRGQGNTGPAASLE